MSPHLHCRYFSQLASQSAMINVVHLSFFNPFSNLFVQQPPQFLNQARLTPVVLLHILVRNIQEQNVLAALYISYLRFISSSSKR